MTKTLNIFVAAAVASMTAGAALAQTTVFTNQDAAADSVEDLEEAIEDANERDVPTFGNTGRAIGFTGSVSAQGTATSGNTDTADLGIGARLGHFDGVNGHQLALSYTYGEAEGDTSDNSLLAGYDYTREIGSDAYVFGQANYAFDEFGAYEEDVFVGAGIGYRVINTNDIQWSVQAGPGFRKATLQDGGGIEEAAASLSSFYYHQLTPTVFVTNDTDVLASESDTYVTNDLGLSVSMSDTLALRTSILTEWHSEPQDGYDEFDNTFGVSVVYTFN